MWALPTEQSAEWAVIKAMRWAKLFVFPRFPSLGR